jgi:hypothetical protein
MSNKKEYDPYGTNQDDLRNEKGAVPIPRNFFVQSIQDDIFNGDMKEERKWEQYFWTKDTVSRLIKGLEYQFEQKTCCLTTPSLAHALHEQGRDETLADIDTRFDYLPEFVYYDIMAPKSLDKDFRILIIDPPFFALPVEQLRIAVDKITGKNFNTHIVIAFLKRAEKSLRIAFKPYNLVPTRFELQYAAIKPNKWKNFTLYSTIDLPGIKRIKNG